MGTYYGTQINDTLHQVLCSLSPSSPTKWRFPRGYVRYLSDCDFWEWEIDGVRDESDVCEEVLAALDRANVNYA